MSDATNQANHGSINQLIISLIYLANELGRNEADSRFGVPSCLGIPGIRGSAHHVFEDGGVVSTARTQHLRYCN